MSDDSEDSKFNRPIELSETQRRETSSEFEKLRRDLLEVNGTPLSAALPLGGGDFHKDKFSCLKQKGLLNKLEKNRN